MTIKNAEFIKSISAISGYLAECDNYDCREIAVSGRSNVGKSSFINMLTGRKKLAKTSSTPGRTRMLNLFNINNGQFVLVDMPGYGFARASKEEIEKFSRLTDRYYNTTKKLAHVFALVDIRHEPTKQDVQMISFLFALGIPFTIVATKADKLSRAQQDRALLMIATALKVGKGNVIAVSSQTEQGKEEVLARIEQVLENGAN